MNQKTIKIMVFSCLTIFLLVSGCNIKKYKAKPAPSIEKTKKWLKKIHVSHKLRKYPRKLEKLHIGIKAVSNDDFAHLQNLANLKELSFSYVYDVTNDGLIYLKGLKKLEKLKIKGSSITGSAFVHLSGFKNLKVLDFSWNRTKASDENLVHLKNLKNLEVLNLGSSSKITGSGLKHLVGLKNLKELSLYWCTELSDIAIEQLKHMKQLTSLSIRKTKITDSGYELLKKALPKCRISFD